MNSLLQYPLFENPTHYLKVRQGSFLFGFFKRKGEQRALNRCVEGLADVRTLCDAPSGPGRLFRYWKKKDLHVTAVELSDPMVVAAREEHRRLKMSGSVLHGDVFGLKHLLQEEPDIVACIRFIYYFSRDKRIELLRVLSATSRRYVLTQYKSKETMKGRSNAGQPRKKGRQFPVHFCSHRQITGEVEEAGMTCVRIVPISQFSDRVFVLTEKPLEHQSFQFRATG
jgi:hypothetical protein